MRARPWKAGLVLAVLALASGATEAEEDGVRLQEKFTVGTTYHVRTRVELSGNLTPPPAKGKTAKAVRIEGTSAIDYDERVLDVNDKGEVGKTMRIYRKLDFRRTLAGQPQELSLRQAVRRQVVLRRGHNEVPFSPDGPLTWGEIDAVRTDVFTPALVGLLPSGAVRAGDRWSASAAAVQELTDLDKVEDGKLDCRLERLVVSGKKRLARVTFSGLVKGVGEDGPVQHRLRGQFHFDVDAGFLVDLSLTGVTMMVDKDGKEIGRVEGRFALTREPGRKSGELTEESLRGVKVEPDAENTQLLYDNRELGLRFLHSRRWRIGRVTGLQVALDAGDGSGLVITLDPPGQSPTARAFLNESRDWLNKQKAKLLKLYTPTRLRSSPPLDAFALEVEMKDQKVWLDYYVTVGANGGATIAARLIPADLSELRKEVDRLARSLVITRRIEVKRKP
jgi:hypothetical protein